ncbi:hypothetical protein CkaCkLH20_06507 [Colletotrichum karsti]|uniref:Aminoglycoside phosphotransferase domain-containing protein n=1 Tax=Colletotrichum karsti TaxID=1095194 RepID=A0A9P6LKE4_9PEZI|nr:uncharacterized protein CkaCkLH20_06507 [Colletotrichum karsti]KAF9876061.1 hypothetical protein CkaCkLH20_06507 [Colletotrichum karsti]
MSESVDDTTLALQSDLFEFNLMLVSVETATTVIDADQGPPPESKCLADVWFEFTPNQRETLIDHLKLFLAKLRNIKIGDLAHTPDIGGDRFIHNHPVCRLRCYDSRAFVDRLKESVAATRIRQDRKFVIRNIIEQLAPASAADNTLVLTHGNLSDKNIFINEDYETSGVRIVAIDGWDEMGFYPPY